MHVPCFVLLFLFQPTNTQIYITTLYLYIIFTLTCFDISVLSSGRFKIFCLAKFRRFLRLRLLKLQFHKILIYFNLIILCNCTFNSLNIKNLPNLARRKMLKLPEDDTEMSKHTRVNIIWRYSVVIYICVLVCWNKNNRWILYTKKSLVWDS